MASIDDPRVTTTRGATPSIPDGPAPEPINPETGQHGAYWVLTEEERTKGHVRPVRCSYIHTKCGAKTTMRQDIAETYARDPKFYGATFCTACKGHFPVAEFTWDGTDELVGS